MAVLEVVEDGTVDFRPDRFGGGRVDDARHVIDGWHVTMGTTLLITSLYFYLDMGFVKRDWW